MAFVFTAGNVPYILIRTCLRAAAELHQCIAQHTVVRVTRRSTWSLPKAVRELGFSELQGNTSACCTVFNLRFFT